MSWIDNWREPSGTQWAWGAGGRSRSPGKRWHLRTDFGARLRVVAFGYQIPGDPRGRLALTYRRAQELGAP